MADPFCRNPFFVLELPPEASAVEVERAGQRLLAMLGVGLVEATSYDTPVGPQVRDEGRVRSAMAALRDPARREMWAIWAQAPVWREQVSPPVVWAGALSALGLGA